MTTIVPQRPLRSRSCPHSWPSDFWSCWSLSSTRYCCWSTRRNSYSTAVAAVVAAAADAAGG